MLLFATLTICHVGIGTDLSCESSDGKTLVCKFWKYTKLCIQHCPWDSGCINISVEKVHKHFSEESCQIQKPRAKRARSSADWYAQSYQQNLLASRLWNYLKTWQCKQSLHPYRSNSLPDKIPDWCFCSCFALLPVQDKNKCCSKRGMPCITIPSLWPACAWCKCPGHCNQVYSGHI